jgi:hypothetical protein
MRPQTAEAPSAAAAAMNWRRVSLLIGFASDQALELFELTT